MMEYKILDTKYNHITHNIRVIFNPKNDVLNVFFGALRIEKLPDLLLRFSKTDDYFQERMSLKFYKSLDWEDLEDLPNMSEGEVVFFHEMYDEGAVEKESTIKQLLIDYSEKLLEVYGNDSTLPESWNNEMAEKINQLKNKVS